MVDRRPPRRPGPTLRFGEAMQAKPANEPIRLTHDGRVKFTTLVTPDGREVWYVEYETPKFFRLMRLRLKDGMTERLHPTATTSEFEPAIAADGEFYAYLKTTGVLRVSAVVRKREGGQEYEIPPGAGFSGLRSPALSPDHATLAYVSADRGNQHIYLATQQGAQRRPFTSGLGINNWPDFSPDGKRIVFSSTRDGNYEIYVGEISGGTPRRLTDHPLQDIRPRFSPDGRRIAFVSHRDGNAEIYVMNADGSGIARLTNNPERDDYPTWHPNGKQLVIVSERDGQHDLYLVEAAP